MTDSSYIKKKGYNILWGKESPLLSTIDLELTERCNNNCIHCNINLPKNDRKAESRELTYDQWKNILDQAAELGVLSVRFTGGEPLLREDFSYLYLHARSIGMKVIIFTNACLLTEEIADMLTRVPPLEKIEITAYGMKQDSYEAVTRKQGSYNAFKNGVNLLLDREIPFIVKSAILPPNKHEIDEFDRWANTMPWMDTLPSYSFSFDLRGRRDSKSKNRQIKALRLTPEEELKIMTRDIVKYKKEMKQFCNNFIGPPGDELFNCGAGRSGCVDAYGMYQPCLLLRHPDLVYDLNKLTLREVLTIKFPNLKKFKAKNLLYLKRCANCFLKGLCEQCPAKSWSEHGTLDTPVEYLCKQAHAQACFLGLISDGEKAWQVDNWQERIKKI